MGLELLGTFKKIIAVLADPKKGHGMRCETLTWAREFPAGAGLNFQGRESM
jgi:hypothetical protein